MSSEDSKTTENQDQHECRCRLEVSRRSFMTTMGVGMAAIAVSGKVSAQTPEGPQVATPEEMTPVTLKINGKRHRLLVEPRWPLLFVLREKLGLTGTKIGCERGECGACTVLIDGIPRYACMTLAVEAEGHEVTTVEGLMVGEELGAVQQAFVEEDAYQCGYCTPGQIMAVEGLLREKPAPSLDEIRRGVSGNLCRCGAYVNIFKATDRAAKLKEQGEA